MKLFKYNVTSDGKQLRPVLLGCRDDKKAAAKIKWRLGTLSIYAKLEPVGYVEA